MNSPKPALLKKIRAQTPGLTDAQLGIKPQTVKAPKTFKIPKLIPVGARLVCACNSGAKQLKVIGYKYYQGTRKRRLTGGIGSVATVTVTKGKSSLLKKVHHALIIRQKYAITRFSGAIVGKVRFMDNAAVLLDADLKCKKVQVKGVIAKEVLSFKKHYQSMNGTFK